MGGDDVAEVKRHVLEVIPQSRFVEGADCPCRQPRRHQQNKQTGPFKECAQVKANAAPVEQEAQHHGGCQPQHCTNRWPDTDILLKRCQQEKHRLQPLARHSEKDHHDQRPAVVIALLQSVIHRLLQLHFYIAGDFTHPEHHPGEDHHRNHRDNTFKQLLFFLREFTGRFVDQNPQAQTEPRGEKHAHPHHANPASALGSLQVTGDKADNQGRFEAFT